MLENKIKIVISQNKYGYLVADLFINDKRVGLTNKLTKFELVWLNNRRSNLKLDVVEKEYKGQYYHVLVIRDSNGYDDEYVILRLDYEIKELIVGLVLLNSIG